MNKLLTKGFSGFLRQRRVVWHFQRRPLLHTLVAAPGAGKDLLAAARDDLAAALSRLKSQADGLGVEESAKRVRRARAEEARGSRHNRGGADRR